MDEIKLLLQELNNAIRIFENKLIRPQFKDLKEFTKWIIKNWTTILSRLWRLEDIRVFEMKKIENIIAIIQFIMIISQDMYKRIMWKVDMV